MLSQRQGTTELEGRGRREREEMIVCARRVGRGEVEGVRVETARGREKGRERAERQKRRPRET